VNRLSRSAAACLRWCTRLLPAGRAEWAEAILEAENVPAGCQRQAWLSGGMRLVSRESMIMRKAGAICAFAAAVGCVASLSWPRSPVNRVTVADRVSLLVTVALLVGLWVAGRRLVGPAGAGRTQRLVRAGGYSAVLALTLGKASVERMRGPANLGPGTGGLLWTGEALFLLMMAIFTIVVIMATAQRSPVTTGTLLRGIAAALPIGIAVFLFLPLGVTRYQASRVLPAVPQGALGAFAWAAVLIAPAAAGVLAARRFTSGQPLPHAAGPASGLSAWLGRRSRCTGRARTARPGRQRAAGQNDWPAPAARPAFQFPFRNGPGEPGRAGVASVAAARRCRLPSTVCLRIRQPAPSHSGVGLDVLNNDDDVPVRTLGDGVPDGQTVRWKMDPVRSWQRVAFGKRLGKRRDWFFEQVKDGPVGGVSKWLRQCFELVPGPVREAKNPVTH
jgi:hypothetical protein